MTALARALRHIEKLIAKRPSRLASAKPTPPSSRGTRKRPKPTPRVQLTSAKPANKREPYNPTPDPVDQVKLAELQAVFTPPPEPPFDWSVTAERTKSVPPLPFDNEGGGTALELASSSPTAKSQTTGMM